MEKVWMAASALVSPLGLTTAENYENIRVGKSGIARIDDVRLSPIPFYGGKMQQSSADVGQTKFEFISELAIGQLMEGLSLPADRTLFILSTTKGNITFLEEGLPDHPRIHLHSLADFLARKFGFKRHLVVSNACISGVMALLVGKRMINAGHYDHAVVVGADVLSRFVISGFQSLQAISDEPCRPFDAGRKGVNLGECAAAILLTSKPAELGLRPNVSILGGGFSNDANHISGPSRTGVELAYAIQQALDESSLSTTEIDIISAHGTATLYNDEMEAKALGLLDMDQIPINSLKGYFGHTLGAAGIAEVAINAEGLTRDELIPSKGFEKLGVSIDLNIIESRESRELKTCLKTASGFGGCNAAVILRNENYF
jgi:3-oxoacyl-[acyl-carrier-protein] synthase I